MLYVSLMETKEQNPPRDTQKKIKRRNQSKPLWKISNLQRRVEKKKRKREVQNNWKTMKN